jgi:hypothetical protein
MPEETGTSGVAVEAVEEGQATTTVESPPPAPAPQRVEYDPRTRLHELAMELVRTQNRRLLIEYLRMRRAGR